LNHFTVPRAIVDLPTDDSGDFILIGGFAANTATQLCTSGFRRSKGRLYRILAGETRPQ
jgi:hypothetical protein